MEKEKQKYTFRKCMNDVHLWVGIGCGILLFIICLTGTMYVFTKEITQWVDRDKFEVTVPPSSATIPLSQLVASLETDKKDSKVTSILLPFGTEKAWLFTLTPKDILERRNKEEKEKLAFGKEDKAKGKGKKEAPERDKAKAKANQKRRMADRERIKTYLVNPYTGLVQGDARTPTSQFFNMVMGLHRWLLLDHDIGRPITGTATLLFLLIEITGLILWLPAKLKSWKKWNAWKAGFKIKMDANWKRINHDLHNTLGFYTFLLITLMALTGLCFSFDWFRECVGFVFDAKPFAERKEAPVLSRYSTGSKVGLDALVHATNTTFVYDGQLRITMPKDSVATVHIQKTPEGFLTSAGYDRMLFDQYSGAILQTERFADKRTGEQIVAVIYPMHVGEIFGTLTKIIYFIACLIATSLPVTGTIIWINKLRKKKKRTPSSLSQKKKEKSEAVV